MYKYEKYILRKNQLNEILMEDYIKPGNLFSHFLFDLSMNLKLLIKLFLATIFFKKKCNYVKQEKSKILFSYGYAGSRRKDYEEMVKNMKKCLNEVSNFDYIETGKRTFDTAFLFNFFKVIKVYIMLKKSGVEDIQEALYYALFYIRETKLKKKLEKLIEENNYKLAITFCDAHSFDNLATQVAKKNKITTVTMQHGLFYYYDTKNKPVHTITLENFSSDYMLAFGEHTVNQGQKLGIGSGRFLKVGSPKMVSSNSFKLNKKIKRNHFGLILDNNYYIESNKNLIKISNLIAQKYGMKFYLRLHPANNIEDYKMLLDENFYMKDESRTIDEFVSKIDFSVLHLTSMYAELLEKQVISFVYVDKESVVELGCEGVKFKEFEGFNRKYEKIEEVESKIQDEYNYYIQEGNTLENYKKVIKGLL